MAQKNYEDSEYTYDFRIEHGFLIILMNSKTYFKTYGTKLSNETLQGHCIFSSVDNVYKILCGLFESASKSIHMTRELKDNTIKMQLTFDDYIKDELLINIPCDGETFNVQQLMKVIDAKVEKLNNSLIENKKEVDKVRNEVNSLTVTCTNSLQQQICELREIINKIIENTILKPKSIPPKGV